MINPKLETFIKVADMGSFNKAAEKLYISSPAVIKQINTLELEIGVELFTRNNKGLELTEAGQSFYNDIKRILQDYNASVMRAKEMANKNDKILRIGISPMTPAQFLVDIWPDIHSYLPDIKFKLIPYENNPENAKKMKEFGKDIDITVGVIDEELFNERNCDATQISEEPLRIAVPAHHYLYSKSLLTIEDLYDNNLMLVKRKWNKNMDIIRDNITEHYPQINIIDFDMYTIEAFNNCISENNLILTIDRWKDIHPLMKTLPIKWNYSVGFGILHSINPSKVVKNFLNIVKQVIYN